MKTLWVVGAGFETVPGIRRAQEMGLRVVVSDARRDAPGAAVADEFVEASTYDAEATLAEAHAYRDRGGRVDGVICIASDIPVTVATLAQAFGLPGIPIEAARLSMDKWAMKTRLRAEGIAIPDFDRIPDPAALRAWLAECGPSIIKPVDSRGARGVLRVDDKVDLDWAFEHAFENSPSGRVMAEAFLEGPQISTEGLLIEGGSHPVGFNDRNYEWLERFHPFIIENGGSFPSHLAPSIREEIAEAALAAGRALGVTTGVVKGDMVWHEGQAKVIEVALRLSGGFFCTHQIPLGTGVDLVGAAIRLAIGEPVDTDALRPSDPQGVAIRYFFPEPGLVTRIDGLETGTADARIEEFVLHVAEGDRIADPRNHTQRSGFVLVRGEDAPSAIALASKVIDSVSIETRPDASG